MNSNGCTDSSSMEADAYERVSAALEDHSKFVKLPVPYPPGIDKVVWSIWDYILGPELRFSWEVVPAELPPSRPGDLDTSRTTASSAQSSSDSMGANLEYDSDFDGAKLFTAAAEVHACGRCRSHECVGQCDTERLWNTSSPLDHLRFTSSSDIDPMAESQSTLEGGGTSEGGGATSDSSSTLDLHGDTDGPLSTLRLSLYSDPSLSQELGEAEFTLEHPDSRKASAAPSEADSSISVLTGGSSAYTSVPVSTQVSTASNSGTNSGAFLPRVTEEEEATAAAAAADPEDPDHGDDFAVANHLLASAHRLSDQSEASTSTSTHHPGHVTDEQYAAIHTLSSEIYRSHMGDSVVDVKLLCVPERKLIIAAYIFAARHRDARAVHSVALLLNDKRLGWFLDRQVFFRRYFADVVPRLKAAILIETQEEILSRMTTEWTQLLQLVGALEHWPLASLPIKVQDTHLACPKLATDAFLMKSIVAHLHSNGHTVVIGTDHKRIMKMLMTLYLFLPDDEKWCCLQSQTIDYCPYVQLQGVHKDQQSTVLAQAGYASWPIAVVNVDEKTVMTSGPYSKHRKLKTEIQRTELCRILNTETEHQTKSLRIDLKPISIADGVMTKEFLHRLDLLPFDNAIREGFVRQFLRFIAQRAFALLSYMQEVTDNGADPDALRMSKSRKALDLLIETDFWIVLAMSERMKPGITEFLVHNKKL